MSDDIQWPTEVRGDSKAVPWLNRLLRACKKSSIRDITVVGGTSKIQDGIAIISMPLPNSVSAAKYTITPFTIYQAGAGNVIIEEVGSAYSAGDILTVSGGVGTSATLYVESVNQVGNILRAYYLTQGEYTTQPAYPNAPTGGSGSGFIFSKGGSAYDYNTFQIRGGMIGARSKFWLNGVDSVGNSNPAENYLFGSAPNLAQYPYETFSNGEFPFPILLDGQILNAPNLQPSKNVCSLKIKNTGDFLLSGLNSTGNYFRFDQVTLCDFPAAAGISPSTAAISFWLELIDDLTDGFHINVWCRMCGGSVASYPAMNNVPFPSGVNIIPLGIAAAGLNYDSGTGVFSSAGYSDFQQYISGDMTGRFQELGINDATNAVPNAIGKFTCYRGYYVADSLHGQVFYPGDIVIDDTAKTPNTLELSGGITGNVYSYPVYICNGGINAGSQTGLPFFATTNPSADNPLRWTQTWSVLVDKP